MNMNFLFTTLFIPCALGGLESYFDLDYNVYLDEEEHVSFHWSLINDTHMEIGVVCINLGWCAVGISPNGQMPDTDINFFWVDDSDSTVYLQDRYAYDRSVPTLDDVDNLSLLSGGQTENITWVRYLRPQFSCDDQDNMVEIGTTRLSYAYQADDPTEELFDSTSSVNIHDHQGSKSVNLLTGSGGTVELEDDVVYVDIGVSDYDVPDDATTYLCKLLKLPETTDKQHIVKFEPIITEGNEGLVHHMLAYYCPADNVDEDDVGFEEVCNTYSNMPVGSSDCVFGTVAYSWAIGGEDFYFPEGVGLEMSGTDDADGTEFQYVLLGKFCFVIAFCISIFMLRCFFVFSFVFWVAYFFVWFLAIFSGFFRAAGSLAFLIWFISFCFSFFLFYYFCLSSSQNKQKKKKKKL